MTKKELTNTARALKWKHGDQIRAVGVKASAPDYIDEIIEWDADIAQPSAEVITAVKAEHQTFLDDAAAQKVIDKASAISKLEALGLTAAEIATINN